MRLVELLREGDDIDFLCVAESLHHRRGVFRRGIVEEGDHARTRLGRSGSNPDHATGRKHSGIGELNAAIHIKAHLECLLSAKAGIRIFGHADPSEDHVIRVGIVSHAAGGARRVEIVEQRRDAGRSASQAAHRAIGAGAIGDGEGQVAVRIEEHLRVGRAVEREGEGQCKLARIVVAQRRHQTALGGGAAIVAQPGNLVAIAWCSTHRGEGERLSVQVELVEFLHHAIAVFDNGHISNVAIGGSGGRQGPRPRGTRALGLAMQKQHLGGRGIGGAATGSAVTRHNRRGGNRNHKTKGPKGRRISEMLLF